MYVKCTNYGDQQLFYKYDAPKTDVMGVYALTKWYTTIK